MKKITDKLNKTYCIILCINIILLNIFVGTTHREPRVILEASIIIEGLIYIIICKIQKKKNILIKGKIDIAIIAMVLVTGIPLICKTYCSLNDTVNLIFQYITLYSMYFIVRNVITTPKRKKMLISVMLIASTLIIIFGIDRLNFNIFQKFYDLTKSEQVECFGMPSIMGYPNAVFAYIVALMIIALGMYLSGEKNTISGLYAIYVQLAIYAFYYCNSRAGMVIFAFVFIGYLASLKETNKIIQAILMIVFTYMQAIIFDKIKTFKYTQLVFTAEILITLITAYIVSLLFLKINKKISIKNTKKNIIILLSVLISVVCIYVLIAKNYSMPIEMKELNDSVTLYTLKMDSSYSVKINYTLKGNAPVIIKVIQRDNQRNDEILYKEVVYKSGNNVEVGFEIKTTNVDYAMIEFYTTQNSKLTINKIYLNGKEEIVNYKYLPNGLMRLIQTFKLGNISISERISMYKSGLQLFAMHPIVGNGAKTYANMYSKVREYGYSTMEVHSYYLDIVMDYGIIGLIICLLIISLTIYNFIKREDKENIVKKSIFLGWLLIAVHTIIDFDLSYLLTITNFYILIALICEEDKKVKYNYKWLENIVVLVIGIIVLMSIFRIYGKELYNQEKYDEAIKYIPYSKQLAMKRAEAVKLEDEKRVDNIISYLSREKNDEQFELIKQLYELSNKLINNGNYESGQKGLNKIKQMIENDEILVRHDVVLKKEWEKFESEMGEDETRNIVINNE